ncbi:hypothetical protein I79_008840 [Cricetulus griseus]|uniref:Uncharacterized protein n=1 Tax=Cricetulus griseus TaxID=10029 RepID=G3HE65_CRIGR|nr:hypothetical protein I79_008840 [Cricetulus griseus]
MGIGTLSCHLDHHLVFKSSFSQLLPPGEHLRPQPSSRSVVYQDSITMIKETFSQTLPQGGRLDGQFR